MKKGYKFLILSFFIFLLLRICLSNTKLKEDNLIKPTTKFVSVSVTPKQAKTIEINPKIFGINIGFAFKNELDKDSGFVQLLRALHPNSLRFPGGTVANYYHPNLPVYGYKKEEIPYGLGTLYMEQSKRQENILYNFIRLCKQTGAKAVFCANVYTGTLEEIVFVIEELQKNKIEIVGVELGNEFCLMEYRKKFPDAKKYIYKIETMALFIKNKYPNLKIVVIGADGVNPTETNPRSKFMLQWNKDLSKYNFYEAYTWHPYFSCAACDKEAYFDNLYLKNLAELAPQKNNYFDKLREKLQPIFGQQKKLWLTEWNISNLNFLENTFVQGAFIYESFLNLIEINTKNNNYIELTNLHSIFGLIQPQKGKIEPLLSKGNYAASVQYFAFQFLSTTLTNKTYKLTNQLECKDNVVQNNFICDVFINEEKHTKYVHFINRSGKKIQLTLNDKTAKKINLKLIDATFPYSTAGKTIFEKDYPAKLNLVRHIEQTLTAKIIPIPAYSFGCLEYEY